MVVIDVFACLKCGVFSVPGTICCEQEVLVEMEGCLEAFCETGTEGIIWSFFDLRYEDARGFRSYEGLHPLRDGDILIFPNREIVIDLDRTPQIPGNHAGVQRGMDAKEWVLLFQAEAPCKFRGKKRDR